MQMQARHGPPVRLDGLVLRNISYAPRFEQPTHSHGSTSVTLVYAGSIGGRYQMPNIGMHGLHDQPHHAPYN